MGKRGPANMRLKQMPVKTGVLLLSILLLTGLPLSVFTLHNHTVKVRAAGNMPLVHGNQIIDGSGNLLILRGAHIESSLEVLPPYINPTEILAMQHLNTATFDVMRNSWNMNAIRIATSDYMWAASPAGYMETLQRVVAEANQTGLYVIISLHEDAKGGMTYNEFGNGLPSDEAIPYWHAVANTFKANPMVMFDIYNEPHLKGVFANSLTNQDWQLWLHGGTIDQLKVHGMQDLVNTIRRAGAQQIIIVEALQSSFQTINADGTGSNFVQDPNIVYSVHNFFTIDVRTPNQWNMKFGNISTTNNMLAMFPMYVGEWAVSVNVDQIRCDGLTPQLASDLVNSWLQYTQQNNISWTAYSFTLKQLFLDYRNYTPTQLAIPNGSPPWTCGMATPIVGDGYLVQQYLLANPPG
jgi:aryl-phospho-beta-D-glucosidase BglC (GH1 family)